MGCMHPEVFSLAGSPKGHGIFMLYPTCNPVAIYQCTMIMVRKLCSRGNKTCNDNATYYQWMVYSAFTVDLI